MKVQGQVKVESRIDRCDPERLETVKKDVAARWEKTRLLAGVSEDVVYEVAALLENQRLMNEVLGDTVEIAKFKRISIPLVRRIYAQLGVSKIINMQAMTKPKQSPVYSRNDREVVLGQLEYQNRILDRYCAVVESEYVPYTGGYVGMRSRDGFYPSYNLDVEAEDTALMAVSIHNNITSYVIGHLIHTLMGDYICESKDSISKTIAVAKIEMYNKLGVKPNWFVIPAKMADAEAPVSKIPYRDEALNFAFMSKMDDVNVYSYQSREPYQNFILCGYKRGRDAGATYMPYVPLAKLCPPELEGTTFIKRIITRDTIHVDRPEYFGLVKVV